MRLRGLVREFVGSRSALPSAKAAVRASARFASHSRNSAIVSSRVMPHASAFSSSRALRSVIFMPQRTPGDAAKL